MPCSTEVRGAKAAVGAFHSHSTLLQPPEAWQVFHAKRTTRFAAKYQPMKRRAAAGLKIWLMPHE